MIGNPSLFNFFFSFFLCLTIPINAEDVIAEQEKQALNENLPVFYIYLWDYETSRDISLVKDMPRFRTSRQVREYLTKDYNNQEIVDLRNSISKLAKIEIVDTAEKVDSISTLCPGYSFNIARKASDVIEFGNFAKTRLNNGMFDTGIFNNPIYFLSHIRYLLFLNQNVTAMVAENNTYALYDKDKGYKLSFRNRHVIFNHFMNKYEVSCFPPIQYPSKYNGSCTLKFNIPIDNFSFSIGYDYSHNNWRNIQLSKDLCLLNQLDMGTDILRKYIDDAFIYKYFANDEFIYHLNDTILIRLINGNLIKGTIVKIIDNNTIYIDNKYAYIRLYLYSNKLDIIRKSDIKGDLFGYNGEWDNLNGLYFYTTEKDAEFNILKNVGEIYDDCL